MNQLLLNLLTVSGEDNSIAEMFGVILLGMGMIWMVVLMFIYMLLIAYAIVSYILYGKGLSAMLRSVGYEKPWLSWVPIANVKALGDLADFYDNGNPKKNFGKKLLRFTIAELCLAFSFLFLGLLLSIIFTGTGALRDLGFLIPIILVPLYIAIFAILIPYLVTYYKALWAIYRIFCPKLSVLFLLLSIFVSSSEIFIIFALRNRAPQNLRGAMQKAEGSYPENPYRYE